MKRSKKLKHPKNEPQEAIAEIYTLVSWSEEPLWNQILMQMLRSPFLLQFARCTRFNLLDYLPAHTHWFQEFFCRISSSTLVGSASSDSVKEIPEWTIVAQLFSSNICFSYSTKSFFKLTNTSPAGKDIISFKWDVYCFTLRFCTDHHDSISKCYRN